MSGPRVLAEGHEAVLLWREDIHYGPRQTGYHGGASLAEVTVPVIVLRDGLEVGGDEGPTAPGWAPAPPQVPEWWNESTRAPAPAPAPVRRPAAATRPRASRPPRPSEAAAPLFDMEAAASDAPASGRDVVQALLDSPVYAAQKARAGRRSAQDNIVADVLRAMVNRGNRAHRDTLAREIGLPAAKFEPVLAAVKRLLNVDGYAVVDQDPDQVTLRLDETLLREQFGLGRTTP